MTKTDRSEFWFRSFVTAVLIGGALLFYAALGSVDDSRCEAIAHNNAALRDLVNTAGAPRTPPEGSTDAQLEGYRVTNQERAQLREVGANLFPSEPCADGVPPTTLVSPLEEP